MAALDTIASFQTTVGSTYAAGTMATGDPSVVRAFPSTARAAAIAAYYDDVTAPQPWRVRSPALHDNARGLEFNPATAAPAALYPLGFAQPLQSADTLTFELSTAATTGKALGALAVYYSQLPGISSRLYSPADISPLILNIKSVFVAVGSGANTAGQWYDLVITTTEDLLRAQTDYAVLGMGFDQAVACVAVKGPDTGNLRCAVPGGTNPPHGRFYFPELSDKYGLPLIPVINGSNKGSTFISVISSAATGAAGTVELVMAQLSHTLS